MARSAFPEIRRVAAFRCCTLNVGMLALPIFFPGDITPVPVRDVFTGGWTRDFAGNSKMALKPRRANFPVSTASKFSYSHSQGHTGISQFQEANA